MFSKLAMVSERFVSPCRPERKYLRPYYTSISVRDLYDTLPSILYVSDAFTAIIGLATKPFCTMRSYHPPKSASFPEPLNSVSFRTTVQSIVAAKATFHRHRPRQSFHRQSRFQALSSPAPPICNHLGSINSINISKYPKPL